ncbi:DUF2796 domain-containing protein [uncultured Algimonas sp.]|uniref:ZrgA family zinc uptake protein n=1 Tax=uncultured Algimonas sp. TaxID=1547920 RepID=UPI0026189A35|nr:DUF2796 domain-containing protein [uncultured Algimonas sp.]
MATEASEPAPEVRPDPQAAEPSEPEIRQADSHVHGLASLALALDGRNLAIELETPLHNLLGFEHAPETEAQHAAVREAQEILARPETLFRFDAEAGCTAQPAQRVDLFAQTGHDDADHDHDHDETHDADHEHDTDHGHHHDDATDHDHEDEADHDHDHDHEHAHRDALLSYQFVCERPDRLGMLELELFAAFEELTELDLVYLGPSRQTSRTVTRDERRIALDG